MWVDELLLAVAEHDPTEMLDEFVDVLDVLEACEQAMQLEPCTQ